MRTPTLGYEDDTTISKSEIASVQLTEAISLFLDQKFLCAITLAGAAEGVLAGLLKDRGEKSIVERSADEIEKLRSSTSLAIMGNWVKKTEIYNHWNMTRNAVKHHDKDEATIVTFNLFDEAYWMIKRALSNASKLQVVIDNELDFENWCVEQLHL